jgi:hypothetical protein
MASNDGFENENHAYSTTIPPEPASVNAEVLARLEAAALDGDDDYIDAVVKETGLRLSLR